MSPWEFNKLLCEIKKIPTHFLVRLMKAVTTEMMKRNKEMLKSNWNNRRNP